MIILVNIIFFILLKHAYCVEKDSVCTTPNGETATCISIDSCKVIKQAIAYLDKNAIDFAKRSQCGYDNGPLVCCGTIGGITTPAPITEYFIMQSTALPATKPTLSSFSPIESIHLPDDSLCGIQLKQKDNRIVGGSETDIDEFPWMVALKYRKDDGSPGGFRCGGTLINNRFVLTAAQCLDIKGFNLIEVRLGEWRFSTENDCVQDTEADQICSDAVLDLRIIQQIRHPYFSQRSGNNDIALLKLEKKVKFTDYIRPICLPPDGLSPPESGTSMYVSGWGITENGSQSDIKLKLKMPMLDNEVCKKVFTNYTHINPNQACAGGEEGKDACHGDAGGPLMTTFEKKDKYDEEQWYQEGIIYRGIGCGRKDVPSLYTRVSRYTYWILNNIQ